MTRQVAAVTDGDVLVGDDAVQGHVGAGVGILHEDGVLDYGALAHLDATEENGVLYGSLDDTAVSDEGVLYVGALLVLGGGGVAHLGENGAALDAEQTLASLLSQHIHGRSEVALQRADVGVPAFILIGAIVGLAQRGGDHVGEEGTVTVSGGVVQYPLSSTIILTLKSS